MTPPRPTTNRKSTPFLDFVRSESFSGFVLIATSALAFLWANSTFSASYFAIKELPVAVGFGSWRLEKSLLHFANDFLMAIFFLMVGLEIKRELLVGELSNPRSRALPVAAAAGGMIVPALIYVAFNYGGEGLPGWGIPMATDIAFALGVMALLGDRVPLGLKVFLTALAIVDDLGAVLVIALFYTSNLDSASLGIALVLWVGVAIYGLRDGRRLRVYLLVGLVVWYFMLKSGVHATIAGVLIALTVPNSRLVEPEDLRQRVQKLFGSHHELDDAQSDLHDLRRLVKKAQSPLHELEHAIAPWVSRLIVPVFAFLNAGFLLGESLQLTAPISLGALLGLLIGKPIGIFLAAWLVVRAGLGHLPAGVNWPAILGAGLLGGIGFTMSLFVSALAFGEGGLGEQAKLGVFTASVLAAIAGLLVLNHACPKPTKGKAAARGG